MVGVCLGLLATAGSARPEALQFLPDGVRVLVDHAQVLDLRTGERAAVGLPLVSASAGDGATVAYAFSLDGTRLAAIRDGRLLVAASVARPGARPLADVRLPRFVGKGDDAPGSHLFWTSATTVYVHQLLPNQGLHGCGVYSLDAGAFLPAPRCVEPEQFINIFELEALAGGRLVIHSAAEGASAVEVGRYDAVQGFTSEWSLALPLGSPHPELHVARDGTLLVATACRLDAPPVTTCLDEAPRRVYLRSAAGFVRAGTDWPAGAVLSPDGQRVAVRDGARVCVTSAVRRAARRCHAGPVSPLTDARMAP